MKDYGRRTYVNTDTSYFEEMRRVTDKAMFDRRAEKQSEFKKPYLRDDYELMEYAYPRPFPTPWDVDLPWPDISTDEEGSLMIDGGSSSWCTACQIHARGPLQCETDPVYAYADKCLIGKFDYTGCEYSVTGEFDHIEVNFGNVLRELVIYPPDGGWNAVERGYDPFGNGNRQSIVIGLTDGLGHKCYLTHEIVCFSEFECESEEYLPPKWSAEESGSIVDLGDCVTISVINGAKPYTWYGKTGPDAEWTIVSSGGDVNQTLTYCPLDNACGEQYYKVQDACGHWTKEWVISINGNSGWGTAHYDCNSSGDGSTECSTTTGGSGSRLVRYTISYTPDVNFFPCPGWACTSAAQGIGGDCEGFDCIPYVEGVYPPWDYITSYVYDVYHTFWECDV